MSSHDLADEPARLEREIEHTRASLHRKLDEIQHRLNPREQVRAKVEEVRAGAERATSQLRAGAERATSQLRASAERAKSAVQNADPSPYCGVTAVAAVAVGTAMAVQGLRRRSHSSSSEECVGTTADDMMGE
jgi:ElaB/YqjD/DUF883 family membrane-anchored ribosome-binding protein